MKTKDEILSLIDEYWNIAYQQGVEGRMHDNEDGDANRVLSEIISALAAPAPLPVAVKIKPLEWKNRTAKTDAGVMYVISGHRKLGQRGFILRIVSGLGTENHNIDDFDEAKAVAQQDYETRSRSPFSSPVGGMEETVTDALRRISELTPARANARTANDLHLTVKAIADTALAGISPTPASDIAALREENEKIRNAGIRFLKAADAYVDGEDIPEETLMVEYGDALDAFRSALQHVAKGERG